MKRIIALAAALVMVLGIVSFASADEPIKVTITLANVNINTYTMSDMNDTPGKWPEMESRVEALKHWLPGYEINLEWAVYEDYFTQLPLLIASGDQPDICIFSKMDWMNYLEAGCWVEDLNPLVDQYGPQLREILQPKSFELCTVGGQLKALPSENYYYKYPTIIRMDWVKKLGFEEKQTYTLSEIKEILTAFTTQDPDGDGKDNTYGLGTRFTKDTTSWDVSFMAIFGAFGGIPNQYYLDKDKGEVYGFNYSDEFRDCLAWIADLYQQKVIDQEVFILSYDQAMQNAMNGRGGMYTGWWNVGVNLVDSGLTELQPDIELANIYITSDDGTKTGMLDNGMVYKTAMISDKCEHPEAAVAAVAYFQSEYDAGMLEEPLVIDGEYYMDDYMRDENGNYLLHEPEYGLQGWNIVHRFNNRLYEFYKEHNFKPTEAELSAYGAEWNRGDPWTNGFSSITRRVVADTFAVEQREIEYQAKIARGDELTKHQILYKKMYDMADGLQMNGGAVYTDFFYGLPNTDEKNEYSPAMDSFLKNWVVSFVTGEKELTDENWQAYKEAAVAQGAQAILNSMLKQYNELNGTTYTAQSINGK